MEFVTLSTLPGIIGRYLMMLKVTDILDIAIMVFVFYKALTLIQSTRAASLLKGVLVFLAALMPLGVLAQPININNNPNQPGYVVPSQQRMQNEMKVQQQQQQSMLKQDLNNQTRSQQQRMQRLLEHEAVSRQEAEAAATRYAQARSTYENTLDLLKDTRLKAPFAGVVERKYVDNFERVQAGQPILRLVNPVTSTVQFTLPENALPLLRDSSTRFTVAFDNYRGAAIPARLKEYVETSSDASGFPVSLTLENPDPARYRISPGMSCTITMQSVDPVPDAVSLPVSAIFAPAEGGTYVWIVTGDGHVVRREVTLGELYGRDRVVVDSGVEPGERVVTAGVYQLRQGERVRILK